MWRQRAFTLLELLVVLVLMGVILTIGVLSLGDGGRGDQIREEGRRLSALLQLAADEAVLTTTPHGFELQPDGYRFVHHRDGEWQVLQQDSLLRPRPWPPGVEAELYIDGHPVAPVQQSKQRDVPQPALLFYPDGERTPFELVLAYPQRPYLRQRITGEPYGQLQLESLSEE